MGSAGTGPGQFASRTASRSTRQGSFTSPIGRTAAAAVRALGRYLGEWDHLGMVTTVAIREGGLWIGTQLRGEPTSADGWLMKIDPKSGKILDMSNPRMGIMC